MPGRECQRSEFQLASALDSPPKPPTMHELVATEHDRVVSDGLPNSVKVALVGLVR